VKFLCFWSVKKWSILEEFSQIVDKVSLILKDYCQLLNTAHEQETVVWYQYQI